MNLMILLLSGISEGPVWAHAWRAAGSVTRAKAREHLFGPLQQDITVYRSRSCATGDTATT